MFIKIVDDRNLDLKELTISILDLNRLNSVKQLAKVNIFIMFKKKLYMERLGEDLT